MATFSPNTQVVDPNTGQKVEFGQLSKSDQQLLSAGTESQQAAQLWENTQVAPDFRGGYYGDQTAG